MFEFLKNLRKGKHNKTSDELINEVRRSRAKLIEETKYLTVQVNTEMKIVPIGPLWLQMCDGLKVKLIDSLGDDYTLALVHANAECSIDAHRHNNSETIHVISGLHVNTVNKEEHGTGETVNYAEKELHGSYFPEDTVLLIKWRPSLNEKVMGSRGDVKIFNEA